jgi:hypothetical protein
VTILIPPTDKIVHFTDGYLIAYGFIDLTCTSSKSRLYQDRLVLSMTTVTAAVEALDVCYQLGSAAL